MIRMNGASSADLTAAHALLDLHRNVIHHETAKSADNKRHLHEHKDFLERQDQQVKNVLHLCMRTIKEMKTDQFVNSMENGYQHNEIPHVVVAECGDNVSDAAAEMPKDVRLKKIIKPKQTHDHVLYDPNNSKKPVSNPAPNNKRDSFASSTPLPGKRNQEKVKLCFDQATQTEDWVNPQLIKIEELEQVLKRLYCRFQALVAEANITGLSDDEMEVSEPDQNDDASFMEENDALVVPENGRENVEVNGNAAENVTTGNNGREQAAESGNQNASSNANVKNDNKRVSAENTRVRRMSAHTTNANEMVPIGNGNAVVPARVLNDIDWTSHTTATRQLLQAIFPRKVLATHSLTGKQSPAHLHKPPKKLLDPKLVDDIVMTVSQRSGVPTNLVRSSITIKCTDEAKLYRNRQRHQMSRLQQKKRNDENLPPSLHTSDESVNFKE